MISTVRTRECCSVTELLKLCLEQISMDIFSMDDVRPVKKKKEKKPNTKRCVIACALYN